MTDDRPPTDITGAAPASLADLIGQRKVVRQVRVALDAARRDKTPFPHTLLTGGPGLGKTETAHVIAAEMRAEFHEVLAQAIKTPADLNAVLLRAAPQAVVLLDEAHELPKKAQTTLYTAIDQRRVFFDAGDGGEPQSLRIHDFSLLLASTDEDRLLQPLRDRMRLTLRFQFYAESDLASLVRRRCQALGWAVADEVYPVVARQARGTPRQALLRMQSAHRVCRAEGRSRVTPDHLRQANEMDDIDPLGLGPDEQNYLRALVAGPARLTVLASTLGRPDLTVRRVIEPFLVRAGLITRDKSSQRLLTAKGRDHLSTLRPKRV